MELALLFVTVWKMNLLLAYSRAIVRQTVKNGNLYFAPVAVSDSNSFLTMPCTSRCRMAFCTDNVLSVKQLYCICKFLNGNYSRSSILIFVFMMVYLLCNRMRRKFSTGEEDVHSTGKWKYKQNRGTGDKGQSSLINGERRWKDDATFDAVGAVDELNATLGRARFLSDENGFFDVTEKLIEIQCTLQDICSCIVAPKTANISENLRKRTEFDPQFTIELDHWIDLYAAEVPPLTQFILPGGNPLSSSIHEARCISRRAERSLIPLIRNDEIDPAPIQYLNRLSDLLFVLARYICHILNDTELSYKKKVVYSDLTTSKHPLRHEWKRYYI
ncbi:Cob(I)yrinic acid a,c-diamide adenosyltransferase, mitochondrial [Trichinella spiralis]|uniref:Corrinoid adenosyltransferase MMAB n=1 Tax=Trichinella spiralis TaxID=6334 RepID=A0A0V1C1T6_TRISP|nr:Cob(I)yrinic acid a,c-diamide adenosyltransferase, mitochondrial [Trichinella spiralis]